MTSRWKIFFCCIFILYILLLKYIKLYNFCLYFFIYKKDFFIFSFFPFHVLCPNTRFLVFGQKMTFFSIFSYLVFFGKISNFSIYIFFIVFFTFFRRVSLHDFNKCAIDISYSNVFGGSGFSIFIITFLRSHKKINDKTF